MLLPKLAIAVVLASSLIGADSLPNSPFVTHEWGTFTSVAGPDGAAVPWAPLSVDSDLPCFVLHLRPQNVKISLGLVRMETPVLYFYPSHAMTVSVHVDFPEGWITDWYPSAGKVAPEASSTGKMIPDFTNGRIEWNSVQVLPNAEPEFRTTPGASHYYAARNTDSAPLRIGDQQEKLLFYRGIGNFPIPLQAKFDPDGRLQIHTAGVNAVPWALLFENRSGKVGYRLIRILTNPVKLDPPELTADLETLRREMAETLIGFGLYRKEALAMVETWRDSWFEEGTRVFYIVPRATVEATLPLDITPAPDALTRVFVGRLELLSPPMQDAIATALGNGDTATLARFGRFLDPFINQIESRNPGLLQSRTALLYLQQAHQKLLRERLPTCSGATR